MSEYIKREAVLAELKDLAAEWRGTFTADGIAMAIQIVEQAPAKVTATTARILFADLDEIIDMTERADE